MKLRRSELAEICHDFCVLGFELWRRKSELIIMNDDDLLSKSFSINSDFHQPYLAMGLDKDDHKFDDVLPHAVLMPALQIFGDADGNNVNEGRIISRSIIFIQQDGPHEKIPSSEVLAPQLSDQALEEPAARSSISPNKTRKRSSSAEKSPFKKRRRSGPKGETHPQVKDSAATKSVQTESAMTMRHEPAIIESSRAINRNGIKSLGERLHVAAMESQETVVPPKAMQWQGTYTRD